MSSHCPDLSHSFRNLVLSSISSRRPPQHLSAELPWRAGSKNSELGCKLGRGERGREEHGGKDQSGK